MFDARTFPSSLEEAKAVLGREKAEFKGEYIITDKIYRAKDSTQGLDIVFLRLRIIPKNIWDDKPVIAVIKNTELQTVGKRSIIPMKKSFDTVAEAEQFIADQYADQFEFAFTFDRIGWQYFLGDDGIDLEEIEGHPSIEFKSATEAGLKKLLELFLVQELEVIKGPSVVTIKKLLKK